MYYQVMIESKEVVKNQRRIYELDVTEKQKIFDYILIPYLKNEKFQFDGYFLSPKLINRIVIKSTDKTTRELSNYENNNMEPGVIFYVSPHDILDYDEHCIDITRDLMDEARTLISQKINSPTSKKEQTVMNVEIDKSKVFIVHGHDELVKVNVARFIESLGFKPVILHEQASSGNTIIEKIEEYSNVGFGVVLYTPCDVGRNKENESELKSRARQNVVFEHGYLMAKLGRNNVCALVKNSVETPNDISGIVYVNFDDHGAWKLALAKELRNSGYSVDMNLVI